jgi:hypothetical protein
MTPIESRLPAPANGRSPANHTKKELVAYLTGGGAIPQWKLNVMTRDDIVALFDLPEAEALAAIDAAGKAHGRKHRKEKAGKTAVSRPFSFNSCPQ